MKIFTKEDVLLRKKEFLQKIKDGAIFICPTDTIYGLSCNALLEKSVAKIRKLKERPNSPFSVLAPSLQWIEKNCYINKNTVTQKWLNKLPGPYTLILPVKNTAVVAFNVAPQQKNLGVRIPAYWFSEIVKESGIPLVTTSANKAGQPFMTSLENLDSEIVAGVDFIIYDGPKETRPSKIIDLTTGKVKER